MSESEKTLIPFEEKTVLQCFSQKEGLSELIDETERLVLGFEHDLSTAAGRAKTASLSAKVARFKVKLDDLGKDLVSDWKTKAKAVDINRKAMRDRLDELKEIARKPLTEYEAEQDRIKEEERLKAEAEALAAKVVTDHEIALLMDREHDRIAEEAAKEAERVRLEQEAEAKRLQEERDKRIAEEARIKAEQDAKEAEAEKDRQRQAEIDKAVREKAEAEARHLREQLESEERAKVAAARAEQEKQAAIEAERKRIADEQERQRIKAETKAANKKHQQKINREALEDIVLAGFTEEQGKLLIERIVRGNIRNITVNY